MTRPTRLSALKDRPVDSLNVKKANPTVEREQQNRINQSLQERVAALEALVANLSGGGASAPYVLEVDNSNFTLDDFGGYEYLDIREGGVGSFELASTAVTAGSYGDDDSVPSYTVDEDGRLTAAADVAIPITVYLTAATGGLAARDFVGVNSSGEAIKAQANSCDTKAIGYVKSAFSAGATAKVYLNRGTLTGLSGLTVGQQYYLDAATAGAITDTPDFTSGYIVQYIGTAISATALEVSIGPAREVGL